MNLNNFNDRISVLPNRQGIFALKEKQNNTEQKMRFDASDNCVLNVEKIQNHWFKNKHPKLCDFIALYYKNKKLYCLLIEMKSEQINKPEAVKQLKGGKKLAQYIADIWESDIKEFKGVIFCIQKNVKNRPIKGNDPLKRSYQDGPIKIDYKLGKKF